MKKFYKTFTWRTTTLCKSMQIFMASTVVHNRCNVNARTSCLLHLSAADGKGAGILGNNSRERAGSGATAREAESCYRCSVSSLLYRSTTVRFLFITLQISKFDAGELVFRIFMDLAKAFNSVELSTLISVLQSLAINGLPLKWFQFFLFYRRQYFGIPHITIIYNLQTS